jgi:hypothetical protein
VGWLTTEFNRTAIRAYDYAISGASVERETLWGKDHRGYVEQIMEDFIPSAGNKNNPPQWSPKNSIFSINSRLLH